MAKLALGLISVAIALYGLHWLLLWVEEKGWIFYAKKKASPSSIGTAFLEIQQMVQPEKRHVLEVRQQRQAEQDEQGGPDQAG